jgi:hypothetical protein
MNPETPKEKTPMTQIMGRPWQQTFLELFHITRSVKIPEMAQTGHMDG